MARATCNDCGAEFETPRPGYGDLVSWTCTECDGRLEIRIECDPCGNTNQRETGWGPMFGGMQAPDTCDRCGESVGFQNNLSGRNNRSLVGDEAPPSRFLMGSIFIFYTSIVALVFALPGMIVGGVVGGASLMALGVFNGILEFGLAMDWWAGKLPAVCALLGVALGVVLAIRYSIHNCGSSAIGEQSIELVE